MKDIVGKQKLKDKVAIVTGGGKGIGRAIVLGFAKEGAGVVVGGRTISYLEEVCREARSMGAASLPVRVDVSVEQEAEKMVGEALKVFGKVDILVNNAGISGPLGLITGISQEAWDEVLDTNLKGMFLCSRAVLKNMMERRSGNIINLSSGAGWRGSGVRSLPYNVSKFGVEGLTHALALQMKPYRICVNALRPGRHDTDFHKDSPPEYRVGMRKPGDVSQLAVFLALQTVDTMTGESIDLAEWEKKFQKD
ncbi:MAG: SDR family NAD(P)-dependent oxidoreductase [Thermodesulfobacteriota bacterium]